MPKYRVTTEGGTYEVTTGDTAATPQVDVDALTKQLREQAHPSLWQRATSGVLSPDFLTRAITGQTPEQLKGLGAPVQGESPAMAAVRAGTTGALGDVANTASGFTSPLSLATMGLGAAGQIPGTVGKVAQGVGALAGAGFAGQGISQMGGQQEGETTPEMLQRNLGAAAQTVGGLAGMKPGAEMAGDQLAAMDQKAAVPRATMLLTRALKPSRRNMKFEGDVPKALGELYAAHQQSPITDFPSLISAADAQQQGVMQAFKKAVGSRPALVSGDDIADAMTKSIPNRFRAMYPAQTEAIIEKSNYYRGRQIPLEDAEADLRSANNDLAPFYAKDKIQQTVNRNDPETGHLVREAEALRSGLYDAMDNVSGVDGRKLMQTWGALDNIKRAAQLSKVAYDRKSPTGLSEELGVPQAIGTAGIMAAQGHPLGGIATGAVRAGISDYYKMLKDPTYQIRTAFDLLGNANLEPPYRPEVAPTAPRSIAGLLPPPAPGQPPMNPAGPLNVQRPSIETTGQGMTMPASTTPFTDVGPVRSPQGTLPIHQKFLNAFEALPEGDLRKGFSNLGVTRARQMDEWLRQNNMQNHYPRVMDALDKWLTDITPQTGVGRNGELLH